MSDVEIFAEVAQLDALLLRFILTELGIVNKKKMSVKVHGKVHIPLCQLPSVSDNLLYQGGGIWKSRHVHFRLIATSTSHFPKGGFPQYVYLYYNVKVAMETHLIWFDEFGAEIPKVWDKLGTLVVFDKEEYFKSSLWDAVGPEIWSVVGDIMNVKTIALKRRNTKHSMWKPDIRVIWGDKWASLKDNNLTYAWEVPKITFKKNVISEIHRMSYLECEEEIVVDLFCGIGYFTIPVLLHGKARVVYASDWNPDAITALRENLIVNGVFGRCEIHEGDSRQLKVSNKADRVILGLLPSSKCGWKKACEALKPAGGILHIHENVTYGIRNQKSISCHTCSKLIEMSGIDIEANDNLSFSVIDDQVFMEKKKIMYKDWEKRLWALHVLHTIGEILKKVKFGRFHWKTEILGLTCVKSYTPHLDYVVLDIKCQVV